MSALPHPTSMDTPSIQRRGWAYLQDVIVSRSRPALAAHLHSAQSKGLREISRALRAVRSRQRAKGVSFC